jgi:type IV pilus assembly protein PilO
MEQLLERINKAPNPVKFGTLAFLVFALTGANYYFYIQDLEVRIASQQQALARLEQVLLDKQEIAQNLNERRKEMDQLEQKLQEALTELPEKKEIDELLAQLNDVGKKSGLDISSISPQPETNASFFARIPIKMTVDGNYHEIAMFLQEVANMRRIVNVNNIRLRMGGRAGEKVILNSEFMATTFRFIETKPPPPPGGPKP